MDLLKINKNMNNDYKKFKESERKIEIKKGINDIVLDILNGSTITIIRDDRVIKALGIKNKKKCNSYNSIFDTRWKVKITPELIKKVEKYLEEN